MDIIVVGAGGHGRETIQCIRRTSLDSSSRVIGVVDEREPSGPSLDRLNQISVAWLGAPSDFPGIPAYVGIGDGAVRCGFDGLMTIAPAAIDPTAVVGDDVLLGPGSIVFAHATITTNVNLGRHVHVGRGAAVGHDSTLADGVSVMPLASISGDVHIGSGALIGTGALLRQGVWIGAGARVGMGAVVLTDVPEHSTVVGNPARQLPS